MRLFVAAWPPDDVVERIAALPRPDVPGLRWTRPDQWHVTLRFLGSVPDAAPVVEALAALAGLEGLTPPVARMGPDIGRFGHRILHVPVDGLANAASVVIDATRELGEPPEDRAFVGHVTLARVRDRARVDLRPLAGTPLAGEWPVRELTLVESRGGRYEVLAAFPLVGSAP